VRYILSKTCVGIAILALVSYRLISAASGFDDPEAIVANSHRRKSEMKY